MIDAGRETAEVMTMAGTFTDHEGIAADIRGAQKDRDDVKPNGFVFVFFDRKILVDLSEDVVLFDEWQEGH